MTEPSARPTPHRAGWAFVALLLLAQFFVFRTVVLREAAPFVPVAFDQTGYLDRAYRAHEKLLAEEPSPRGVRDALREAPTTGALMHCQALACFLLLGPGRLTALLPHFLYFAAFECVLVAVLLRRSGRWDVALFGLGLLLTASSPWLWVGGLFDFRIDGIAFSLYGILVGLVVLSDEFASRRWSMAVAAAVVVLILFRYIMAVHLAGVLGCWFAVALLRLRLARAPEARAAVRGRLLNALAAGAVVGAVCVAVLAPQVARLVRYYVVGHLTGTEKNIRAVEEGVTAPLDFYLYYPRSVAGHHAGPLFLAAAGLGLAAAAWMWLRREPADGPAPSGAGLGWALSLFLLVPAAILTAGPAKSPVVGNVLIVPLLWGCALLLAGAAARSSARVLPRGVAAAALALAAVSLVQVSARRHSHYLGLSARDRAQVMALHDDLIRECLTRGWAEPTVSCNTVVDFLPPNTLNVPAYERHGVHLRVWRGLGGTFWDLSDEEAKEYVLESEVVVLREGDDLTNQAYPAAGTFARLSPWLREHCESKMELVGTYAVLGRRVSLYARPSLSASNAAGDCWVTSQGLTLHSTASSLRKLPHVRLSGKAMREHLPRVPKVEVSLTTGGRRVKLPARMHFPDRENYTLEFEVPASASSGTGAVDMQVTFDAWFVPRDLGVSPDDRRLVVFAPTQLELRGAPPGEDVE